MSCFQNTSEQNMDNEDVVESDMVFLGLITFFDPPKDTAKQALWRLAEKGVKAKVLTGDSLSLAIKICQEVGIRTTHVTTGPDLDRSENTIGIIPQLALIRLANGLMLNSGLEHQKQIKTSKLGVNIVLYMIKIGMPHITHSLTIRSKHKLCLQILWNGNPYFIFFNHINWKNKIT